MSIYIPSSASTSCLRSLRSTCPSDDGRCRTDGCVKPYGHPVSCIDLFVEKISGNLIRCMEDEIHSAQGIFAGKEVLISRLKKDISGIQDTTSVLLQRVSNNCGRVDQAISELERAIEGIQRCTTNKQERMNSFVNEVQQVGREIQKKDRSINELAEELSKEQAQLHRNQARIHELECSLEEQGCAKSELQNVKQMLAASQKDARQTSLHRSQREQLITELQNRVCLLEASCELQRKDDSINKSYAINKLDTELSREQAQVRHHQARIRELECSLKEHGCSHSELEKTRELLTASQNEARKAALHRSEGERLISELQSRVSQLSQDLQDVNAANSKLCKQGLENSELKESLISLQKQQVFTEDLERRIKCQEECVHTLTSKLQEARCDLQKKDRSIIRLGEELTKEQEQVRNHQTRIEEFKFSTCALQGSWLPEAELLKLTPGSSYDIPVWALRWDHTRIHANLIFTGTHVHDGQSIFRLVEDFMRGRQTPADMTEKKPLNVFIKRGPDELLGVYTGDTRRLVALMMYQAISRDQLILVRCSVCAQGKTDRTATTGLAIRPHGDKHTVAFHCREKLFNDGR